MFIVVGGGFGNLFIFDYVVCCLGVIELIVVLVYYNDKFWGIYFISIC